MRPNSITSSAHRPTNASITKRLRPLSRWTCRPRAPSAWRRVADYPALWRFTRDIYNLPKIAETVNLDHIRRHYYESHTTINPTGVVPLGPVIDFAVPATSRKQIAG
jgi:hypothetical protein